MQNEISDNTDFVDFKINIKIKLAFLWTSLMFCYIYGDYFLLYAPNKIESLISGENNLNTPLKLFSATILLVIPALMVCLSIFLKSKVNRVLNMVFGVIYTLIMLLIAFTSLSNWMTFYVFLAIVESTITSIIVWRAFKWPKNVQ
tara:strand:- start:1710 stop:2144 length:435 start_codon:yes stop_codon:yes gene_type:complete